MSLPDIINRCKKNDRKAQFQLYERGFNTLMRVAHRYKSNKEDAAAIVNMAFFKILTNLDKYDQNLSFEGWSKRILTNTIIDEFRKEKKINEEFVNSYDDFKETDIAIDHNLIERALSLEEVDRIMNQLGENERLVFNLFEIDEYPHKEIATMLGISERTSKRYLAQAKIRLKEIVNNIVKPERAAS